MKGLHASWLSKHHILILIYHWEYISHSHQSILLLSHRNELQERNLLHSIRDKKIPVMISMLSESWQNLHPELFPWIWYELIAQPCQSPRMQWLYIIISSSRTLPLDRLDQQNSLRHWCGWLSAFFGIPFRVTAKFLCASISSVGWPSFATPGFNLQSPLICPVQGLGTTQVSVATTRMLTWASPFGKFLMYIFVRHSSS